MLVSANLMISGSCVATTIVQPCSLPMSNMSRIRFRPEAESRLAVGSSAKHRFSRNDKYEACEVTAPASFSEKAVDKRT